MCGIAGLWSSRQRDERELRSIGMTVGAAIAHRGPDADGIWVEPNHGVLLAHRRLSILDTTPAGAQPMRSADRRFTIIYNGEVYNFAELRDALVKEGRRFRGHSDTEVILEACARWGAEQVVPKLNGMYAFALWDERERTLFLARDPLGIKPLYYGWFNGDFIFGSELKALRAVPGFVPELNTASLGLFFKYNYIPAPHSVYQNVLKLPPGHCLRLPSASSRPTPTQFWTAQTFIGAERRGYADPTDAIDDLDGLLRDGVSRQMISDVPLGAFLSGGIDSSLVVALMQHQSRQAVKTFSIGFEEAAFNEATDAAAVARHLGTEHRELIITSREALELVPQLPNILDEPLADASAIPTYFVSRLARKEVTVSLSGDGGDELFMGYNHCLPSWTRTKRIQRIPAPIRRLGGVALSYSSNYRLDKYGSVLQQPNVEAIYSSMASHWHRPSDIVANMQAATVSGSVTTDALAAVTYWDIVNWLPDDVLAKVDRMSMAVSLETRVPLLDQRVVEYALSLPVSLKLRNNQRKWLLRQVLYRYVPPQLVDRPKKGFAVPVSQWLRGPLREWAESLLAESSLKEHGHLHSRPIRQKWDEHLQGTHSWGDHLWSVLMFQAWFAKWH